MYEEDPSYSQDQSSIQDLQIDRIITNNLGLAGKKQSDQQSIDFYGQYKSTEH